MKKQLLLLVLMMLPMVASADAVEINGIYYNLITKGNIAEVTSNPNKYSGNITIPESVKYEGIEYSVKGIGDNAFQNSTIISVTIPNSVTSIGVAAFYGCQKLSSIAIPNSITTISRFLFYGCVSLASVTIPNSVTLIDDSAFMNCEKLTSITIPNSVISIGASAFSGTGLTSIVIPNSITIIDRYTFLYCPYLTSITIPNSIKSIKDAAFQQCTSLTSVTIPNSVTSIEERAFNECTSLLSITIGDGIKSIGSNSFAKCQKLTDVYCYAEGIPQTKSDAFSESYIEYATLHVPSASVNAYKAADPWKGFKSIVAIDGETPSTQKCEKPTISYENGQLKFASATDGVEFVSEITDSDIKKNYEATVSLAATYNITVYATKSGYDNSDVATATLCWVDASPKTEGITNGIANIPAQAVLIQSEGGSIKVQGVDEGTQVNVYGINGTQAGSAISQSGAAIVNTNLQPGSIAIVKIGQKSVKVVIK